jgi:hypothetical protein
MFLWGLLGASYDGQKSRRIQKFFADKLSQLTSVKPTKNTEGWEMNVLQRLLTAKDVLNANSRYFQSRNSTTKSWASFWLVMSIL